MKPDNETPREGQPGRSEAKPTADARADAGASGADAEEVRDDHRDSGSTDFEAARETPGNAAPAIRHRNRPERDKAGGNYHGPRRGRE